LVLAVAFGKRSAPPPVTRNRHRSACLLVDTLVWDALGVPTY